MNITISKAKKIREELEMTHLVIFAIDKNNIYHVATHGDTIVHAQEAAKAGNKLKDKLGFPENLCKSVPSERIHSNCHYYNPDYGIHCMNGWSDDGSKGYCCYDPKKIKVKGSETACHNFEPNC